MFVSTHAPSVFSGIGKVVLVFEIICLFFDHQAIFYDQMTTFSSPNVMNFYSMNICNFRTQ